MSVENPKAPSEINEAVIIMETDKEIDDIGGFAETEGTSDNLSQNGHEDFIGPNGLFTEGYKRPPTKARPPLTFGTTDPSMSLARAQELANHDKKRYEREMKEYVEHHLGGVATQNSLPNA